MSTTAPTPDEPGRWVVSEFGRPSVLTWLPFSDQAQQGTENDDLDRLTSLPSSLSGNHVLVRIITAGIAGTDNLQRAGGYPNPRAWKPGFTPGYDFVGGVVSLGPEAQAAYSKVAGNDTATLNVGDLVTSFCVLGAYASHIVIPSTELLKLLPSDDPIKITALPLNYMTAFGLLKRSGVDLRPGSSILIGSASGGVGTAIAQLVKAFNMDITMIGTTSASKFEHVKSLGITPVDRKDPDVVRKVRALTPNGGGVDVAYDAVGSEQSLQSSKACVKKDTGEVLLLGVMDDILPDGSGMRFSSEEGMRVVQERLAGVSPRAQFWGIQLQYYNAEGKQQYRQDLKAVIEKVRSRELDPVIGKLLPLRSAVQANEMLVSGAGVMGKLVFIVDGEVAKSKGLA